MSREQKNPTPASPEATSAQSTPAQSTKTKGKSFGFSFALFRKTNGEKAFTDKVAPSRRELEARATKRQAQKEKRGLVQKPVLVSSNEVEDAVQAV